MERSALYPTPIEKRKFFKEEDQMGSFVELTRVYVKNLRNLSQCNADKEYVVKYLERESKGKWKLNN